MVTGDVLTLAALLLAAVLYSSVGHGGASGYLAAMALVGLAPEVMKPTALTLNVLVATIGTISFARAGHFDWRTFWPFAVLSIPAAFVGGLIQLPAHFYRPAVGVLLLVSAAELARSARRAAAAEAAARETRGLPLLPAIAIGGAIGLLSGLTGIGGGIFLSPILLFTGWARTLRTSAVAAAFILVNSLAGLAGAAAGLPRLPTGLPVWVVAVVIGAVIGTQLGSRWLPVSALRYLLAAVLVVAGLNLIVV